MRSSICQLSSSRRLFKGPVNGVFIWYLSSRPSFCTWVAGRRVEAVMDVNPLAVILVENGSKGDRLLFRYPYDSQISMTKPTRPSNFFVVRLIVDPDSLYDPLDELFIFVDFC